MAPKKRRNLKASQPRKRQRRDTDTPTLPADVDQNDAAQTKPSPFFVVLPREIRDQIYHEIWRRKVPFLIDFERGEYQFKVCYDDAEEPADYSARPHGAERLWADEEDEEDPGTKEQPLWILANSQVLEEAMAQFHHKLTWTFMGNVKYEFAISPKIRIKERLPCFVAPSMARQSHLFLLRPWDAHTLILSKIKIHMQIQLLGRVKGAENLWTVESQLLKWLRAWRTRPPRTRRLLIEMRGGTHAVAIDSPTTIQLNNLTDLYLHDANYIEFSVSFSNRQDKMDFVESKLRQRLSETGLAIMGGKGEASFEASAPSYESKYSSPNNYPLPSVTWTLKFHRNPNF